MNVAKHGIIIGGAAISPETVRYFSSLDLNLKEAISMTEAAAFVQMANIFNPGDFCVGMVGKSYNDQMEIKLINKDEIGAVNCYQGEEQCAWANSTTFRGGEGEDIGSCG